MTTNHGHESGDERNPSVKYDKSDLTARGILIFFLVLVLAAVAVQLVVLGLYAGMTKIADQHAPEISPLAPKTVTPRAEILTNTADVNVEQFPQPRLLIPQSKRAGGKARQPGEMTKFLDAGDENAYGEAVAGRRRQRTPADRAGDEKGGDAASGACGCGGIAELSRRRTGLFPSGGAV